MNLRRMDRVRTSGSLPVDDRRRRRRGRDPAGAAALLGAGRRAAGGQTHLTYVSSRLATNVACAWHNKLFADDDKGRQQ